MTHLTAVEPLAQAKAPLLAEDADPLAALLASASAAARTHAKRRLSKLYPATALTQLDVHFSEARCIEWGGHLASVESPEEDAFIGAWPALLGVPLVDGSGLWLGGTDAASDGNFRWWDDRPLSFTAWASDQPNNGAGVDCIEKRNDTTQRWYDRRCTDVERYVCERPE